MWPEQRGYCPSAENQQPAPCSGGFRVYMSQYQVKMGTAELSRPVSSLWQQVVPAVLPASF